MAATSEQISITQNNAAATTPSIVPGVATSASINSMRKSSSDRRPSFSITLPPSCSRSHIASKSAILNESDLTLDNNGSTAGFEEALLSSNSSQSLEPPGRRRSVQFIPASKDDNLTNHDAKSAYLPKTPYPTTSEEDERLRNHFGMH
ncbi:hypothetical protein MVEG_10248 [Podila verticillata NRRL 6337]|nr:MAG: hypothetical protein BYD32DRAFT_459952 [Podila humilis]KFH64423.1 hypothetical protein MVEG_10248 [Podila verticillata NRRL 6337]